MRVARLGSHISRVPRSVVTVGRFDGVHVGHQRVLAALGDAARNHGALSVVALRPLKHDVPALTSLRTRLRLLEAAGVQHVFMLTRGEGRDASSIARALGATALVDGGGRTGNGLVEVVPTVAIDGERVSSRRLCRLISLGHLDAALSGLGRRHSVEGRVVHGFHRGAPLGIPTANLRLRGVVLPPDGVYAVRACVGETELQGVANIGFNPTFGNTVRSVETHLLDFSADLYGRRLQVEFVRRLRGEQRFAGIDALLVQIKRDIASAREIFATIDG